MGLLGGQQGTFTMMGRIGGKGIFWWGGIKLYFAHVPFKGPVIHPSGNNITVFGANEKKVLGSLGGWLRDCIPSREYSMI